jgi:capsular exopolysaccharide synthesis family protein
MQPAKAIKDLSTLEYTQTQTVQVSREALREQRIIAGMEAGPELDAYRILRTRVLQETDLNKWSVIAVTSPAPGVGKSINSVNLALSIAMDVSRTVMLVDADLRQPRLHRYFSLNKQHIGLADYLADDVPLEPCLVHPDVGRVTLFPAGRPLRNSSEMLSSPKMQSLIQEMKHRYAERMVIFDLPPLLASDDALAFIRQVDAVLLVVEDGKTTSDELQRCAELMGDTPLIGTVLNKVHDKDKGYYYY